MPLEVVFARQERPADRSTLEQVQELAQQAQTAAQTAAVDAVAAAQPRIDAAVQQAADSVRANVPTIAQIEGLQAALDAPKVRTFATDAEAEAFSAANPGIAVFSSEGA